MFPESYGQKTAAPPPECPLPLAEIGGSSEGAADFKATRQKLAVVLKNALKKIFSLWQICKNLLSSVF